MIQLYVFSFVSGMAAANGVPHFVKGATAQKFQTPFGRSSSAVVNVAWGWFNFVLAAILMHFAHPWSHLYRAAGMFAIGVLVLAIANSLVWSKRTATH